MRLRLASSLFAVAVLGLLAACAGGSEPRTGDEPGGGIEETTDGADVPAGWSAYGETIAQPSAPATTAAAEKISRAERARVLDAARTVERALDEWDARVAACAVDTWTSCLSRPRRSLLLALYGAEGLLWRERGAPEGPCRSGVRFAYDDVYGFRLSQARADYSDPAPGTAPSGDPDLANLQVAVNVLRTVPGALRAVLSGPCA